MNSTQFAGLIALAVVGTVIVIIVASNVINQQNLTSEQAVPITAGVVGFIATMVTTIFQEISSRYKEKRENAQKRWELVYPMLKESYIPLIENGKKLRDSLLDIKKNFTDEGMNRVLFFIMLFYGHRFKHILKHGGTILLGTKKAEKDVDDAYQNVKNSFQWAGIDTRRLVSTLQEYFIKENKEVDPIVYQNFIEEIDRSESEYKLKSKRDELRKWLVNKKNAENASSALDHFVNVFDDAISKFSGRE